MNYQEYLCSRDWSLKKNAVHERAGELCERCLWRKGVAVHHKTYEHIYNERLEDLELLCDVCHAYQHGKEHEIDIEKVKLEAQEWIHKISAAESVIIAATGKFYLGYNTKIYRYRFRALADMCDPSWRINGLLVPSACLTFLGYLPPCVTIRATPV